jgi:hypothetical protein
MPDSKEPARLWFENLVKIQGEMRNLNHLTETNIKDFSKQKQGDLLLSELIKGNLSQFCFRELGLMVPTAAFEPTKTFVQFLNRISFSIEEAILTLFYRVAVRFNPILLDKPRSVVAKMPMKDVYGSEPLNLSPSKRELHSLLMINIPGDFYPISGEFLKDPDNKLVDVIKRIIA